MSNLPPDVKMTGQPQIPWLGISAFMMVMLMVFIMGLLKIYSPDLGFHLKSAEWIIKNKQFIYFDSFSYGSAGNNYYDLQWIYQLFIYSIQTTGGEKLLIIVNSLLIVCSILLMWLRFSGMCVVKITSINAGLFAFITLLLVQPLTFEIRPHVFSWIFLNIILSLLESYKSGTKKRAYYLPFVMLIWVNSHSLFILGILCILTYFAGIYLETGKADKLLLKFLGLSVIACLFNPYFLEGLLYPFTQFSIVSQENLSKLYIGELQSPFTVAEIKQLGVNYFKNPLLFLHLGVITSIFVIYQYLKLKQFTYAILISVFLFLLYLAHKNYGYFLIATLPLLVNGFVQYFIKAESKKKEKNKLVQKKEKSKLSPVITIQQPVKTIGLSRKSLFIITIIVALFISITSITDGFQIFRQSPHRFGFTYDNDQLPVEATRFLNEKNIKGKILNHIDFGGYLMANYSSKVFIDARMEILKQDFFTKYFESLTQRRKIEVLINEYNPDIVIFPYLKATLWWDYFLSNKTRTLFKPIYVDGLCVIYVKSSAFPSLKEIEEKDFLSKVGFVWNDDLKKNFQVSKPVGLLALTNSLLEKQYYPIAEQSLASYCFTLRYYSAALSYSLKGIKQSTIHTPNIYKNLAIYYRDKGIYNEALQCEEKSE